MPTVDIMSTLVKIRQDDGTFVPIYPVNTTDDVYIDFAQNKKLSTYLLNNVRFSTVDTLASMYALSRDDVHVLDLVIVTTINKIYLIVDIENLDSSAGYVEIITSDNLNVANGVPQLDGDGKLPVEVMPSDYATIQLVTYTSEDI